MTPEQIITQALDDYESLLISYAREITGELESAKDAVQETFLRLSSQNLIVEHLPQMPVCSVQNTELTSRFRGNHVFILNLKPAQARSKRDSTERVGES